MREEELFLLQKEVRRLFNDFSRCSDVVCKEMIRQDILFLSAVINHQVPVNE